MPKVFSYISWGLLGALVAACSPPDTRAFAVENALFAAWYQQELQEPVARQLLEREQAEIAAGLGAICRGDTRATAELLRSAVIGHDIGRLALIAAKADRRGACDYAEWPARAGLHRERWLQLQSQGDGPVVLLNALLDSGLPAAERQEVVAALAARHYGQAQAVLVALQPAHPEAERLLAEAVQQGVALASLLQAERSLKAGAGGDGYCPAVTRVRQLVPESRLAAAFTACP